MEHYRSTAHTRFDIKFHLVWITKYRKKLIRGDVGLRLRQIVRTICAELDVQILKGHVRLEFRPFTGVVDFAKRADHHVRGRYPGRCSSSPGSRTARRSARWI